MGQIIDLEHVRIVYQEKVRNEALKRFPWREMERTNHDLLQPMVRSCSWQKRHILLELTYRTVYEAFVFGMLEAKTVRAYQRDLKWLGLDDIYRHFYQESGQQLMDQLVNEFSLFQCLNEWKGESVWNLLENLVQEWFIRGACQKWKGK